jgi:chemotaxis protein MotB
MADDKPIIIIKKKGGHGGHHGGAWKVAYADFVTAMMAFFMVMWLVNTADQNTKQNIASYFRRPGLFQSGSGTPLMIGEAGILQDAFVPPHKSDTTKNSGKDQDHHSAPKTAEEAVKESKRKISTKGEKSKGGGQADALGKEGLAKEDAKELGKLFEEKRSGPADQELIEAEKSFISKLAESLRQQIASSKELSELLGIVDVKIDADGLNVEIMDTEKTSMFASGSSRVLPEARAAFAKLAEIMKKLPNKIDLVGHTDAKPFASKAGGYSNWELSSDRAQAARRILEQEGIAPERFTSVIGRAYQEPKVAADPMAPANRRITLKMRFKFNSSVDLSKDPNALADPDNIPAPTRAAETTSAGQSSPTARSGAQPTASPQETQTATGEKVHSLTPKQVLNDAYRPKNAVTARESTDRIKLPDDSGTAGDQNRPPSGDIFGDNPVIGPKDLFTNF